MKALKGKLIAIWNIVTSRNFILIHHVNEICRDGSPGSKLAVQRRTDFTSKRDMYVMTSAIAIAFKGIKMHIPDEIDQEFFNEDGSFKKK